MAQPSRQQQTTYQRPVVGVDYYLENGRWVFTESWHLRRGYCCLTSCRHCPWGEGGSESTCTPPTRQSFNESRSDR